MSKILQVIGVLALLSWTGAGIGAWMLTKEQVHVTIEEGAGDRLAAVDPTAELADRFQLLQGDLRGLGQSLSQNFQVLDEAAAERAEDSERSAAAMKTEMREELARIERKFLSELAELRQEGAARDAQERSALRAELDALRLAMASSATVVVANGEPEAPSAVAASGEPATTGGIAATGEAERHAVESPPEETEPAAEASAALTPTEVPTPKKKRSFVAFDLPSDSFAFEGRRRWELIPSLSRVGFDAKSTLHDFTGVTQKVEGHWTCDLSEPTLDPEGRIQADASALDTGLPDRNTAMYEKLDTAKHPAITFEITAFRPQAMDKQAMKLSGIVVGNLKIQEVALPIEMPVKLSVDEARRLAVEGELTIEMSKWGIEPPSQLGMISVRDKIKIWIALRGRAQAVTK